MLVYNHTKWSLVSPVFLSCTSPSFFSAGTNQEIRYTLMTFGIPTDILPIADDGTILLENHEEWINQRVELEKMDRSRGNQITYVYTPGPFDILLGRGKATLKRPGNIRYKFLIEEHAERYEKTPKAEKTVVAEELLLLLKSSGSRFLKFEKGRGWTEVGDAAARDKISMSFRDRRQQSRREQDDQQPGEPGAGVTMTLSSLFDQDMGGNTGRPAINSQGEGKRPRS